MASNSDNVHKLVLHPLDALAVPVEDEQVLVALGDCGLIGRAFDFAGASHHFPGEHFLELITFLGCSPAVALEPPGGAPTAVDATAFCNVHIEGPLARMRFRPGIVEAAPRCPACRASVDDWRESIAAWRSFGIERWTCPECGATVGLHQLNWRHNAGFGRIFAEIWGIHPHEAVPADALLACLHESTGQRWTYCYTAS